jgi:hypothetical protein
MSDKFFAFGQKLGRNKKGSALKQLPSLRPCVGAPVALQQSRILRTSTAILSFPERSRLVR